MKNSLLVLAFLFPFCQQLFSQYVIENENYSFHKYELLDSIFVEIITVNSDSIEIRVNKFNDFALNLFGNYRKNRYVFHHLGQLINSYTYPNYVVNFKLIKDSLLIIENYEVVGEDSYLPFENMYGEDSVIYTSSNSWVYVYPPVNKDIKTNSQVINLHTNEIILDTLYNVYGIKKEGQNLIHFDRIIVDNGEFKRKVYELDLLSREIVFLGYFDFFSNPEATVIINTGISSPVSKAYNPNEIFWKNLEME